MLALLILILVMSYIEKSFNKIGTLRVFLFIIMAFVNLLLSKRKYSNISIISTIFFPPIIFLLFPTLIGYVEEESFVYYPFIVVAFAIMPQLLLIPEKDKFVFWFSVFYYLVFLLFIDVLLRYFSPVEYIILERIDTFYIYYKAAHLLIFLFVVSSAYYLRSVNQGYEDELYVANLYLTEQSKVLSAKNQVLVENRKELENKNQKLEKLRNELKAQNQELHATLAELKEAQNKLIQSEKLASLGVLTAGVAHEINNPLNYIAGGIAMLEIEMDDLFGMLNELESTPNLETLEVNIENSFLMIKEGIERVVSIVESLRTYTTGANTPRTLSDINVIIQSALKYLECKLDRDIKVTLKLNLKESVPVSMEKIHQVFLNILDNGIFALRKSNNLDKELKITTESQGDYAKISIYNNGPVIPESYVLKVFDPFFTTKEPNEGTGLGMSISYNIIKEHRGDIELVNEKNKIGFHILLPLN